jgi:hypothetical protein
MKYITSFGHDIFVCFDTNQFLTVAISHQHIQLNFLVQQLIDQST